MFSDREQGASSLEHGGSIARARTRWGEPAEGWLDLSTGINPFAYPVGSLPIPVWARLPDDDALANLLASARAYYKLPASSSLVAAAGSQALIGALPFVLEPSRVAVLGLTYGEHAHRWRLAKHDVRIASDLSTATDADIVVITNPNNPDGVSLSPEKVLELAQILRYKGGLLVIDEAFCDVAPELSLASATGLPSLLILRSFGKFFGLAGLRLGFALGAPSLIERIAKFLGPWAVSGPALHIATHALQDNGWIVETRKRLTLSAARLERLLIEAGLEILGGTDLFKLAKHPDSQGLVNCLGQHGILVREFAERSGWVRFGLPPDERGYQRLAAAMISLTIGKAGKVET